MSEWFMELVLKTSDAARHRGFESLSLRQNSAVERDPRVEARAGASGLRAGKATKSKLRKLNSGQPLFTGARR